MKDVLPALIEIGGKEVMDDCVLKIAIENELSKKAFEISNNDIHAERLLFQSMYNDLPKPSVNKILRERGIGPERERQLLWRNAALRKLVAHEVHITEDSVKRMYEIIHGAAIPTRIIVTTTHTEASEIFTQLQSGASFFELATKFSIDSSATRGGLVDPIPLADPLWPTSIREALPEIGIGEFSNPIFIGDRWIIVQVTGPTIISGISLEQAKSEMQQLTKLAQERFLMESLAESLQQRYSITFFNDALQRASSSDINELE